MRCLILWQTLLLKLRSSLFIEDGISVDSFLDNLLGYTLEDLDRAEDEGRNATQRRNKRENIMLSIIEEFKSCGDNHWGVFNGVTRYTNHVEGVKKNDAGLYINYGGGKQLVDKAFSLLTV